jgi:hypothetical protein
MPGSSPREPAQISTARCRAGRTIRATGGPGGG